MTQPYVWADVQKGQAVGSDAINGLGNQVETDDALLAALIARSPVYANRNTVSGAAVPTVDFTGIPSTLNRLRLSWSGRSDVALNFVDVNYRINNDVGANYRWSFGVVQNSANVAPIHGYGSTGVRFGYIPGTSGAANTFGEGTHEWSGWDAPGAPTRQYLASSGTAGYLDTAANEILIFVSGAYFGSPTAYNRLTLFPSTGNFVAGSDFQLEGW
jgi:hypothetical protein